MDLKNKKAIADPLWAAAVIVIIIVILVMLFR